MARRRRHYWEQEREQERLLEELDAAYRTLGIEPADATVATVQAAWRELVKQHHTDFGGVHATIAAINAARDIILTDLEKNKGTLTTKLKHRRKPSSAAPEDDAEAGPEFVWPGDADPPPAPGTVGFPQDPVVFQIIVAVAGSGKTREWCRDVASDHEARVVIAAPTTALDDEITDWLYRFKCRAPYTMIHSAQGGAEVKKRIQTFWNKLKEGPAVLVCTHAAILDQPVPRRAPDFTLVFDEVLDSFSFTVRSVGETHERWSRHLIATPYVNGVVRLRPKDLDKATRALQYMANNPKGDEQWKPLQEFWATLVHPHTYVLTGADEWKDLTTPGSPGDFGGALNVCTILSPMAFQAWRQVMIMGARATKTLTYLFWQRVFGVKFVPHPLQAKLPAQHVNGHRLTIRYFWPERATRAMLKLRAAQGGSMQAAMCAAVADFFGDAPFIWSLPQSGEDGGVKSGFWTKSRAFAPRLRIPGRSYGLNYLREHHNVALLSVINLPPQMYQLLEKLGITSDEVTLCLAFAILYQDLLRSSLRDPTAVAPVICVVPDLPSALALQDELPGSRIEQTPEHLIPVLAEKKKPGSKPDPNDKRTKREKDRDRQRRKREKDREQAA